MSSPLLDDDLLSPAGALQLDHLCDRFELACKAGQRPAIEQFLGEPHELDRDTLLRELLLLDVTYRGLRGENPGPADYVSRFADRTALIAEVFADIHERATPIGDEAAVVGEGRPTMAYDPLPPSLAHIKARLDPLTTIGKYRVVERLGSGGQGEVFRAVHPDLPGRDVVIKWARQGLPPDKQQLLLEEGRVLARLDDPGLVRVYDVDVHEGHPFIVFEYVAGRSLAEQMQQGRPSLREAVVLVAQLARTLARVNAQGILHRDLKPANVLIDTTGRPRLLDFGLAWLQPPFGAAPDRPDRSISGTPQYMAPEQARGQTQRVGPPSDVFGLGAILYEMLTGQPPYQDPDRLALWEKARRGEVAPPRRLNRRVPRALEAICMKALAADPAQRYAGAFQLEAALRRYLSRPQRVLIVSAALLLIGGAVVLAATLGRSQRWGMADLMNLRSWGETAPLSGELVLRAWSPDHGKMGVRLDQPGALPLRTGEMVQLEVKLNQPGYCYILLLDSQGTVQPLYPWRPEAGLHVPPPAVTAVQDLHSPPERDRGWELDDHSGLETILLLVRRTPLAADYDLAGRIGSLPVVPLRHPQEYAVRGADRAGDEGNVAKDLNRGFQGEAKKIDEPLLRIVERLRPDFELIRAVRFAHVSR